MHAFALLCAAEMRRYFAETRTYLANYVAGMVVTGIIVTIFALQSDSQADSGYWVGFAYWYAASTLLSEASISLSTDKQSGTFTQLMLRPTSMLRLITAKTLVWTMLNVAVVTAFMIALFAALRLPVGFAPEVIPASVLTLIGLFGFTLVFAALTIVYTKTAAVQDIVGYAMLLVTGAVVPLSSLPAALAVVGRLLPITAGIDLSRRAICGVAISPADWAWFAGQSATFVLIGYGLFAAVLARGRRRGISLRY